MLNYILKQTDPSHGIKTHLPGFETCLPDLDFADDIITFDSNEIWTPHLKKYINIQENVQRRARKLVDGFYLMSYSERLKKLNLPSLVYRRARGDMIEIFKHFYPYDNGTVPENFRPRNRPSRKHDYQPVCKAPKDSARGLQANFFYFRTIKTWNELPKEIVHARIKRGRICQ